jgi:hypothetical protein
VRRGPGTDFIAGGHGIATDTTMMSYGKAAFLLKWNGGGRSVFYWMPTDTSDPWNPAWTTPIGSPSGAMSAVGTGWRRNYSDGTVIVNPNKPGGSSITYSLGASYKTPSGSTVTSAKPPAPVRKPRRVAGKISSTIKLSSSPSSSRRQVLLVTQRREVCDHVLDLLGGQQRFAFERRCHARPENSGTTDNPYPRSLLLAQAGAARQLPPQDRAGRLAFP